MKDPAFLFYTSDFYGGISDLTMEERGQYITLLCLQHLKGHLSEKTILLSVPNVSPDVMKKFIKDENNLFYNIRLEKEINKRLEYAEKQRERVKKRWDKKDTTEHTTVSTTVIPYVNVNINEDIDKNEIIDKGGMGEKSEKPKKKTKETIIPTLEEFIEYAKTQTNEFQAYEYSIKAKYESWVENGWKDGFGNKIINWKSKFKNTITHLKKFGNNQKPLKDPKKPDRIVYDVFQLDKYYNKDGTQIPIDQIKHD